MTTRDELLNGFEAALAGESSFLLPPSPVTGQPVAPDGKTRIVETAMSFDGQHELQRHAVYWMDWPAAARMNQDFYVLDPGTVDEQAKWLKDRDPRPPTPDPTMTQHLIEWLQERVLDGTIRHFENVSADPVTETGTCTVVRDVAGKPARVDFILWKDAQGDLQYEVINK